MAKLDIAKLQELDGFLAAALVDIDSGMAAASVGTGIDLEVAAAGNTEVIKAKRRVASALELDQPIEDILITLSKHYHLIRPLESNQGFFIYVVLDRAKANLAMARHEVRKFEKEIDFS